QAKQRPLSEQPRPYLHALGIANQEGKILQQGKRKFRQINKYIELIEHLLREQPLEPNARLVDMGSGKGYLTFALYDYLVNQKQQAVQMTGIELRQGLVDQCNGIAKKYNFNHLEFIAEDIHQYQPVGGIDMLIALHACDTATDEALAKGIRARANIIVVAPCCHKQVRKSMKPPASLTPMLQHGILLERQAEMLTDAIRSLLLEANGYKTKVFEFVGTEHTPKNVMITAVKSRVRKEAQAEIDQLKSSFGLSHHHLEQLLAE
ncbi:MAG: SAM-dependent methyltransferase, partial [Bacteroidota bacterium]